MFKNRGQPRTVNDPRRAVCVFILIQWWRAGKKKKGNEDWETRSVKFILKENKTVIVKRDSMNEVVIFENGLL